MNQHILLKNLKEEYSWHNSFKYIYQRNTNFCLDDTTLLKKNSYSRNSKMFSNHWHRTLSFVIFVYIVTDITTESMDYSGKLNHCYSSSVSGIISSASLAFSVINWFGVIGDDTTRNVIYVTIITTIYEVSVLLDCDDNAEFTKFTIVSAFMRLIISSLALTTHPVFLIKGEIITYQEMEDDLTRSLKEHNMSFNSLVFFEQEGTALSYESEGNERVNGLRIHAEDWKRLKNKVFIRNFEGSESEIDARVDIGEDIVRMNSLSLVSQICLTRVVNSWSCDVTLTTVNSLRIKSRVIEEIRYLIKGNNQPVIVKNVLVFA